MASAPDKSNAEEFAIATYVSIDRYRLNRGLIRYALHNAQGQKLKIQLVFIQAVNGSFTTHVWNNAAKSAEKLSEPIHVSMLEVAIAFNPPPTRKKPLTTVQLLDDFNQWLMDNNEVQLVSVTH